MTTQSDKIKIWLKENKLDIFYGAATIVVLVATISVFIWSVNIVLDVVNSVFSSAVQDKAMTETSSFDLAGLNKISGRLNVILPPAFQAPEASSTSASSTATANATSAANFAATSTSRAISPSRRR